MADDTAKADDLAPEGQKFGVALKLHTIRDPLGNEIGDANITLVPESQFWIDQAAQKDPPIGLFDSRRAAEKAQEAIQALIDDEHARVRGTAGPEVVKRGKVRKKK